VGVRKLFEQLMATIREFVKQRDDLLLVVPCEDTDVPLLMKALRDVDCQSAADLFLLFAEDFETPASFVDSLVVRLREEHQLTNKSAPDAAKLPPLPNAFTDAREPSFARLEAGLEYGHGLVDVRAGQHFVWGMGPGSITDTASYLKLLAALLPDPDIRPWMQGVRIVARVPANFRLATSPLARYPRVRVRPFSIPPDAHEAELLATADDLKAPIGERMQAEVQLGYIDLAYGRSSEAIGRFLKSLAFFQWAEVASMEALIICGLGDIARREQNLKEALHWYQCALVPAGKDGNRMLLATIVQHLAAIAFQQQRFDDAEEHYSELVAFKRAMIEEDGLAEALEWQGLSQERQEAYDRAVDSWYESALICKSFEMTERLPRVLAHLKRGYRALEMYDELERFDAEWRA
jgi:hypothetical protein